LPHLTLDEIALQCGTSKTSVHHIASTKDKVPENHSLFCGRTKKLTLEQEALILTSILELRKEEGSFSSQRLVEHTGIHHVTDQNIRHSQARKKCLMSQPGKDQRVEFARKMQAEYSASVWTESVRLSIYYYLSYCSISHGREQYFFVVTVIWQLISVPIQSKLIPLPFLLLCK